MRSKILIAFILLSVTFIARAQVYDAQDVENYIAQYKDIAMGEMHRTGIPASITLAQGIIESGAGRSPLATDANNHFGIKCHEDWKGDGYKYDDDRRNECFRKYDSVAQSFYDHSDFLKTRQRYAVLFTYDSMDYRSWAKGLKSCGYATNPKYAEVLIKCIEDYDLHQWDLNESDRATWFAQLNKTDSDKSFLQGEVVQKDDAIAKSLEKESDEDRVYVFNDIKCVNLREGELLNQLATKYEIGLKRLMRYNDIASVSQLEPGDKVYLQPKRNHGDEKFHTVQEGETMFSISRDHGIQLDKLYEKNLLQPGSQPAVGEVLNLREARDYSPKLSNDPAPNQVKIESPSANSSKQFYVVAKGDTLYSISKKYNLSIDELKRLNALASNDLKVGEKLRVK